MNYLTVSQIRKQIEGMVPRIQPVEEEIFRGRMYEDLGIFSRPASCSCSRCYLIPAVRGKNKHKPYVGDNG